MYHALYGNLALGELYQTKTKVAFSKIGPIEQGIKQDL